MAERLKLTEKEIRRAKRKFRKTLPSPPGRRGPKRVAIDEERLYDMAKHGCTNEEICSQLNIDIQSLYNNYSTLLGVARSAMRESLRRAQFKNAVYEMNSPIQIWLGKQLLGQRDQSDINYHGQAEITIVEKLVTSREELQRIRKEQAEREASAVPPNPT